MKWLYWIGGVLVALVATYLWLFQPSWHRYRLTLAVETPEGVRQASGVLQSVFSHVYTPTLRGRCELSGEALFLDLPGGRNLVMLLGECNLPLIHSLGLRSGASAKEGSDFYDGWPFRRLNGSAALPLDLIPTLVTFRDLNDPASAQVIRPQGLEAFGPGYALKEVRLEMVSAGLWPFNLLPIPVPQALFGTPITKGIEKKMPGLRNINEWNQKARPRLSPADSYGGGSGALIRNW